jgi:prepilin-type N-terminal cleavage/methylation domain-containing protein
MKRNAKNRPLAGRSNAFSLIELIGVLAILAIAAAFVFYSTTASLDVAVSIQENTALQSFAASLQNSALRNRYIPGTSDWYSVIATELGVSTNTVLYNLRNPGSPRVFMIDPNLRVGVATGGLPYDQSTNAGGSIQPTNCRVMIVSSIAPSAPLPAAGIASSNFSALWSNAVGSLPANGTFNGWKGTGGDLKIQRVILDPLFVKLTLANYVTTNQGQYKIGGVGPLTVPNPGGTNGYYLLTTPLDLLTDAGSGGTTNARLILDNTASYYYVAGTWRNIPYLPAPLAATGAGQTNADAETLAQMISVSAAMFSSSPYNINAQAGWTPPLVVNAMSNFMVAYPPYANWVVNSNGGNWVKSGPYYNAASAAQTTLGTALNSLFNNPVQGGCTNAP